MKLQQWIDENKNQLLNPGATAKGYQQLLIDLNKDLTKIGTAPIRIDRQIWCEIDPNKRLEKIAEIDIKNFYATIVNNALNCGSAAIEPRHIESAFKETFQYRHLKHYLILNRIIMNNFINYTKSKFNLYAINDIDPIQEFFETIVDNEFLAYKSLIAYNCSTFYFDISTIDKYNDFQEALHKFDHYETEIKYYESTTLAEIDLALKFTKAIKNIKI